MQQTTILVSLGDVRVTKRCVSILKVGYFIKVDEYRAGCGSIITVSLKHRSHSYFCAVIFRAIIYTRFDELVNGSAQPYYIGISIGKMNSIGFR